MTIVVLLSIYASVNAKEKHNLMFFCSEPQAAYDFVDKWNNKDKDVSSYVLMGICKVIEKSDVVQVDEAIEQPHAKHGLFYIRVTYVFKGEKMQEIAWTSNRPIKDPRLSDKTKK